MAGAPVTVKPVPVHDHLLATLEEIRDAQVAAGAPHDRLPAEHGLAGEVLPEENDALLLGAHEIGEAQAPLEQLLALEVPVQIVTTDPAAFLLLVQVLLELRGVELGGAEGLELGVHHELRPVGVRRAELAVNPHDGVDDGRRGWQGDGSGLGLFLLRNPAGSLGHELSELPGPFLTNLGVDEVTDQLKERSDDFPERPPERSIHGQVLSFSRQVWVPRYAGVTSCQSGGSVSW